MDERYYIFGGVALLLLALIVYLFDAVARYRRAVRNARQAAAEPEGEGEGEARYLTDDDRVSQAFAASSAESAAGDEPDEPLLLDEPSYPVHEPKPVVPEPNAPEPEADEIAELLSAFGAMGVQPEPVAEPILDPTSEVEWQPPFEAVFEPAFEPEPEPAPTAGPQPGYSLADELDRLMTVAESQSVFLPHKVHEQTLAPVPVPEPQPVYEAAPLLPPLSVGQALSAPEDQPGSVPEPAPAPVSAYAPEPPVSTPAYALVAPVELQFTGGGGRVGVRPGTRSYAEFQRLAGIMLSDLRAARGR